MYTYYDKVFVTNLLPFYKINLYNEISSRQRILVIVTGDGAQTRNANFFKGNIKFKYISYQKRNIFYRLYFTLHLLRKIQYKEAIVGGWDSVPLWLFALLSPRFKNSVVIESSYIESVTNGLKGLTKRIFISRIRNKAYVSGSSQQKLAEKLRCRAKIVKTKGVGVFNYVRQPEYVAREKVKNFLFVGRLVEVKNLEFLIRVFNELKEYTLHIAGFGKLEPNLRAIASDNIVFLGAVDNEKLSEVYQQNDVFILPSKSEPWGLVVEEALNNGLPVLVSNRVGCASEIVNDENGLVFKWDSEVDLRDKINRIVQIDYYNQLRHNISKMDFEKIEIDQINCYLC